LYNKIIANDRKMYKKRPINFIIATSTKSLDLVTNLLLLKSGMAEIDPKKTAGNHRSGFKTSDGVKGQGAGRSRKRSISEHVSNYRMPATQPLSLRWGFETTSTLILCI